MSLHDYVITNAAGATVRADINLALLALISKNSYATDPASESEGAVAYMWWYDTGNNILKIRNADDDAWINFAKFDQTNDTVIFYSATPANDTETANKLYVDTSIDNIKGLVLSNDTDTTHDIAISTGRALDSTLSTSLILSSILTKQIDATWAAGDDAGGLFTGSVAADTTYHLFIIEKDSDGSIDAGFDTSVTAANRSGDYTKYRRVGSVLTDGSSNILGFNAVEIAGGSVDYTFNVSILDRALAAITATTRNLITLSTPLGVVTQAKLRVQGFSGGSEFIWYGQTSVTDFVPSGTNYMMLFVANYASHEAQIWTDSSSQIAFRRSNIANTSQIDFLTIGFIDGRAQ